MQNIAAPTRRLPFLLLLGLALAWPGGTARAQSFDLLIRNGRVLDGTGNPYFLADIGIRGDEIAAIGDLEGRTARRTIDATGLYVVPGFIDMHSHADDPLTSDNLEARQAHNLVMQGITTIVVAPDGRNAVWPVSEEMAAYRRLGTAMNVVPMVGHNTVRGLVMGDDYERPATPAEVERMQALVRQGMEAGAWGLGAGLEYRPGRFSNPEEVIALAEVVADYDGFYYAHQRSQSVLPKWQVPSLVDGWPVDGADALKETIRIARETGIRVVASHIKAKGRSSWGRSATDVILMDRAREEGLQVYFDQYPYETYGGSPTELVPGWALADPSVDAGGGLDDPAYDRDGVFANHRENLRRNWRNTETRELLARDIEFLIDINGGADRVIIVVPLDSDLRGKTLAEVAEARRMSPVEAVVELALSGDPEIHGGVLFRPMAMSTFDVVHYMEQPYTATSSDAGVHLEGRPGLHPRYYGSFVRKIAHYVKEAGVISLPFAVRSSTGLPAQIIGLPARGYLREGYKADVVIFDYEELDDRATVLQPKRYPEGIEYVLVNGEFTVDGGAPTGALPGVVIDRNEVQPSAPDVALNGRTEGGR